MKKTREHLPIFGIGPFLVFPMTGVTIVAIVLSAKGIIPFTIQGKLVPIILLIVGILLIIEGIACFIGANFGHLVKCIKSNTLKTTGSYAFVRNPCYAMFLLGCTGAILIAHNPVLLILPILYWLELTIVLSNTEEKWLEGVYGQEYLDYKKRVNRCIPWFPKNK